MSKLGIEHINSLFENTFLLMAAMAHWAKSDWLWNQIFGIFLSEKTKDLCWKENTFQHFCLTQLFYNCNFQHLNTKVFFYAFFSRKPLLFIDTQLQLLIYLKNRELPGFLLTLLFLSYSRQAT